MSKIANAKIGMAVTALALMLSIFVLCVLNGSTAWFADNNEVSASNMPVSITEGSSAVEKVEYFPISSITLSGEYNNYNFSSTPITDAAQIQLGTFSSLSAERQLLIKITLSSDVKSVKITAKSAAESYIIQDSSTLIYKDNNSLSSVVEFYAVSDLELQTIEGESCYVVQGQQISDSPSRFSTLTTENGTMTPEFTPSVDIYQTPDSEEDSAIYILVDYYEMSMEYVSDHVNHIMSSGSTDIIAGENINFACDFEIWVE